MYNNNNDSNIMTENNNQINNNNDYGDDVNRKQMSGQQSKHGHRIVLHRIIRRIKRIITCGCLRSSDKNIDYGEHRNNPRRKSEASTRDAFDKRRAPNTTGDIEMVNRNHLTFNNNNADYPVSTSDNTNVVIPTAKNIKYLKERTDSELYLGQLNQMESKYQREKRLSNGHPSTDISLQYAIALSHSEKHDTRAKSFPILLDLLKEDNENKNYLMNLGTSYFKDEKYQMALECAERILRMNPLDSEAMSLKYLALNGIEYQKVDEPPLTMNGTKDTDIPKLSPSIKHQIIVEDALETSNKDIDGDNDSTSDSSTSTESD
ncbi:hypothetical protein PPL_05542 [Heterostelium album PN500]|uniref:Uncharacterized protein n=1 Tax=Heterostelium pallidum (strain ATCC 26659 / Pp 5 / PN500) TaxID=670386 RepID=D3BAG6_HETP5|nr:hypothetical protein PPL_05542 [Heterostelium album PN500]EFA81553.1 hypothetical protein PPL_05542 [Heterostelium album PN500]|eukprot:XP_020433670.1 hypothetical protein PPL_05542 [Heterostelium album PN500]